MDADNDVAAQPLITNDAAREDDIDREDDDICAAGDDSGVKSPGAFVWALTFSAGVSGLLFGYDTGVISSTLVSIGTDLSNRELTTLDKSLITSSTSLLALLASPITGFLADSLGRKRVILIADALFILGALWQAFSTSVWFMILGRGLVGLGVGSASFVVPLYISELAPSPFRGRLVTVSSLFITGGQVVSYVVGWLLSGQGSGWRWMVGLGAAPAVVQIVTLLGMPETPRWLIKADRKEEALRTLEKVYGNGEGMDRLVRGILRKVEREIEEEESTASDQRDRDSRKNNLLSRISGVNEGFADLFAVGANRRALILACMLQGFQQLCGFNSLMYFSATIFALVGFNSPTMTALSVAITNFLFTFVAFYGIDRLGRRRILLSSIPIMALGLALCAVAFSFLDLSSASTVNSTRRQDQSPDQDQQNPPSRPPASPFWPFAILLAMIVYVASYAVGMGTVPWQMPELFPLRVRAIGSGLATATNWASNFLVGLTFLPMMELFSPSGTFVVYAAICVLGWGFVWRIYPETAGLGLEDIGVLLKDGWGVKESVRRWRGG